MSRAKMACKCLGRDKPWRICNRNRQAWHSSLMLEGGLPPHNKSSLANVRYNPPSGRLQILTLEQTVLVSRDTSSTKVVKQCYLHTCTRLYQPEAAALERKQPNRRRAPVHRGQTSRPAISHDHDFSPFLRPLLMLRSCRSAFFGMRRRPQASSFSHFSHRLCS